MSHDAERNREDSTADGSDRAASPEMMRDPRVAARRRFLTGGIATIPVVATLKGRSALAGTQCTVSGWKSGNMSGSQITCRGMTCNYWQHNPGSWPSNCHPGPANPITYGPGTNCTSVTPIVSGCSDYGVPSSGCLDALETDHVISSSQKSAYKCYTKGTTWTSIFGSGLTNCEPQMTLMHCLWGNPPTPGYTMKHSPRTVYNADPSPAPMSGGTYTVLAQCVAAYLNCIAFPASFGYTQAELILMVQQRLPVDPAGLAADLNIINSRG